MQLINRTMFAVAATGLLVCWGLASTASSPGSTAVDYRRQALSYQAHGMIGRAVDEYKKAVALNPLDASSHNNLALALKDLGLLDQAEKEERIAIKVRPEQANYHYNLAIILQHKAKLSRAATELKKAARLKDDPDTHFKLAQIQLERLKGEDSENEIRQALSRRPNEPVYLRLLGDALMLEGRESQALAAYSQAQKRLRRPDRDLRNKIEYLTQKGVLSAGTQGM